MLIVVHIAARWVQDRVHGKCRGSIMSKGRFYRSAIHLCLHGTLITNTPTLWIHIIFKPTQLKISFLEQNKSNFQVPCNLSVLRLEIVGVGENERVRKLNHFGFDDLSKLETSWDWKKWGEGVESLGFVSSVRSSYSHPDLLLIHHHHPTFSVTHQSSTLDFHFLTY